MLEEKFNLMDKLIKLYYHSWGLRLAILLLVFAFAFGYLGYTASVDYSLNKQYSTCINDFCILKGYSEGNLETLGSSSIFCKSSQRFFVTGELFPPTSKNEEFRIDLKTFKKWCKK